LYRAVPLVPGGASHDPVADVKPVRDPIGMGWIARVQTPRRVREEPEAAAVHGLVEMPCVQLVPGLVQVRLRWIVSVELPRRLWVLLGELTVDFSDEVLTSGQGKCGWSPTFKLVAVPKRTD
jgi:hypothetical protein